MKRSYDEAMRESPTGQNHDDTLEHIYQLPANSQIRSASNTVRTDKDRSDNFCRKCKAIDFVKIFSMPLNGLGMGRPVTGFRQDYKPDCQLCRLFASLCSADREDKKAGKYATRQKGYRLFAIDSRTVVKATRSKESGKASPSIVVGVLPGYPASMNLKSVRPRNSTICRGLIAPAGEALMSPPRKRRHFEFFGRVVEPLQISYPLLVSWINECQSSLQGAHKRCKLHSKRQLLGVKVIDCWTRDIIPLVDDMEYLTLSYVWGPYNVTGEEESVGFVPQKAPRTIEDAMFVTRNLGMKYLWVDKYCIDQSGLQESTDKHNQIRKMDKIYEGAVATLVATIGETMDAGICGVSVPRTCQTRATTNAGLLVSTGRHLSYHTSISTWAKRGWTYQETFLSRRCLFFTRDGAIFVCRTKLLSESVSHSSTTHPIQDCLHPRTMTLSDQTEFRRSYESSKLQFRDHLREFTSRSLTFPRDGLNAFRGVLARSEVPSYWGVPFQGLNSQGRTADMAFVDGLIWRRTLNTRITRRKDFPSWTWASLPDQVDLVEPLKNENAQYCSIMLENNSGRLISLDEALKDLQKTERVIPEGSRYLHISGPVFRVCLRFERRTNSLYWGSVDGAIRPEMEGFGAVDPAYLDTMACGDIRGNFALRTWDAICLRFELSKFWLQGHYMLLDWNGPTVERIGLLEQDNFRGTDIEYNPMQDRKRYQTIRLG